MASIGRVMLLTGIAGFAHAQDYRETAVPDAMIPAIVRDVAQWHDVQHPDCRFEKPLGSVTVGKEGDGSVEHWSVEACDGKAFTYKVTVFPRPDGGVSELVSNIDGSPVGGGAESSEVELATQCRAMREEIAALGDYDKLDDGQRATYTGLSADLAVCDADDHDAIQGVWLAQTESQNGRTWNVDFRYVFSGNTFTFTDETGKEARYSFTLDTSGHPKLILLRAERQANATPVGVGYELEGDTLTIVVAPAGSRPADISDRNDQELIVSRRQGR